MPLERRAVFRLIQLPVCLEAGGHKALSEFFHDNFVPQAGCQKR